MEDAGTIVIPISYLTFEKIESLRVIFDEKKMADLY
jgi:hypothetical protein